jgi:exosortase/archaeosortase
MTKTKKQKKNRQFGKDWYIIMAVAELGAIGMLGITVGQYAGIASKVFAFPLAIDLVIRLNTIRKAFKQV